MKTTVDSPVYPFRPVEATLRTNQFCPIRNITTGTMLARTTPAINVATFGTWFAPLLRVTTNPCCSVYISGDELKTSGLSKLLHSPRKVRIKTVATAGPATATTTVPTTQYHPAPP